MRRLIRVWLGILDTGFVTAAMKKFLREIWTEVSVISLILVFVPIWQTPGRLA
jgi:hypothetical protein